MTVGVLAGRLICGWLCLFGLIQELLYKIPVPKIKVPENADRRLRYLKYVILAVLVIGLPLLYRSGAVVGEPFFCRLPFDPDALNEPMQLHVHDGHEVSVIMKGMMPL